MKRRAKAAAALGVPEPGIATVVEEEEAAVAAETATHRQQLIEEGVVRADGDTALPLGRAALVIQGLYAGYEDVEVLHGIDLAVHAGRDHRAARREWQREDHVVLDDFRSDPSPARARSPSTG